MKTQKKSNIIKAAEWAKKQGFIYMSSTVKSHFKTVYYHVVKIDDILSVGKWIPAQKTQFSSGAHGRLGTINVPEKTIERQMALRSIQK